LSDLSDLSDLKKSLIELVVESQAEETEAQPVMQIAAASTMACVRFFETARISILLK
jgi:hypothetical protein